MTASGLCVVGGGATTAVGLTAAQTCAAIRAGISGLREELVLTPGFDAILGARVPAGVELKRDPESWLVQLAVRTIRESLSGARFATEQTALLLCAPEPSRAHPGMRSGAPALLDRVVRELGVRFHPASCVRMDGHATAFAFLHDAEDLLRRGFVSSCLIAGVDSLVNLADCQRLAASDRLHRPGSPQGIIPGEGASCVRVEMPRGIEPGILVEVPGFGRGAEPPLEDESPLPVGKGWIDALRGAIERSGMTESDVDFCISDWSGERYQALESILAHGRYYRTRRSQLKVWHPARSVGDLGAASGPLMLLVAGWAFSKGYAPGRVAMCEASSDAGLRAACVARAPATQ